MGRDADFRSSPRPEELDEWARIATDPSATEEDRNAAWSNLQPLIERWARHVAGRFRGPVRRQLLDDSLSTIFERLSQYRVGSRKLAAWCKRVLLNFGVDLWRKADRQGTLALAGLASEPVDPRPSPEAAALGVDEQRALREDRRRAMDDLANAQWKKTQVDYRAVLWVKFRLAQAAVVAEGVTGDQDDLAELSQSQFVAWSLHWRDDENQWRLRDDWPTLERIWQALSEDLDREPFFVTDVQFCRILSKLLGCRLNSATWQQWVKRGKGQGKDILGCERWNRLFGDLLPDRRPPGGGRGGGNDARTDE